MRPLLLVAATLCLGAAPVPAAAPSPARFSPDLADKSLDPCADFFEYACSKFNKAHPIPEDLAHWDHWDELELSNRAALRESLESAAASASPGPLEKKIGDFWASCMDEEALAKAGVAPLQPILARVDALADGSGLPELLAFLHQTVPPGDISSTDTQYAGILFGLYPWPDFDDARTVAAMLDQAGMSMPGREFYLQDDEKTRATREQEQRFFARMLELSGETGEQAEKDAASVMALETGLARASMDAVTRRDPKKLDNRMTLAQLEKLTPSFAWKRYLAAMKAPPSKLYLVATPDYFRGLDKLIAQEPVAHWRAWLRVQIMRGLGDYLSEPISVARFEERRIFKGTPQIEPRWRRCVVAADTLLGEAVGQAWAAQHFPPESKARMLALVQRLEQALREDIRSSAWMAASTRARALKKLDVQIDKIGYPDTWRDYGAVEIKRGDYFGNVVRAGAFETRRGLAKMGKPVDRKEWFMTPPTVNAYEDAQTNTINFPAGVLQPPFFDPAARDAVNFGATGAIIGHELTHGFDDEGRKFDASGNLKDWWTEADAAAYEQRGACIAAQYTQEVPEAGAKQDGKLSQGEDTADNGGLRIALMALEASLKAQGRTLDSPAEGGLSELQSFYLSWANAWCGTLRPEAARTAVLTNPHSLSRYRVNNVVANMPEFARAFACKAGAPMVREKPCRVW